MVDGGKGNGKEHREFFLFNTELFVFFIFFGFGIFFFCFIKHGGALFNMVVPVCFYFYFFWFCFFLFFLTLC